MIDDSRPGPAVSECSRFSLAGSMRARWTILSDGPEMVKNVHACHSIFRVGVESMPALCRNFVMALLCAMLLVSAAAASTPRLNTITPRGIKLGGDHTLKFSGQRLNDAEEVFFYDTGITVVAIEPIDANNINVKVTVAADCRVGEHVAQVRTKNGISDYRSVFVGRLPEVAEVEPNNELSESQKIDLNVTVTGVVNTEDIDYFRIEGKKGDRISVEVEAIRLGFLFDPAIALLDKTGLKSRSLTTRH